MDSSLHVYNTLTKQKEVFVPKEKDHVRMYVCGPTTYNFIHLGNARPIVVFDTIRRYLEYSGYKVTYIQNFTDVDDKIINKANEEGESPIKLAARYINEYFIDADKLKVKRADVHPKVSEHMDVIIDFVRELEEKGYAYEVDGDVYFSVRKFADYGKLSGRSLDDLLAGARVEVDQRKKDPLDFALWKKAKAGEPAWDSPWGPGRPGWHIECSAMSNKYLGQEIDIHGGGYDLVFPHHENEIAQTEALLDVPMARYWLHNGFITVNQEKMSKSLGNFFLLREILAKFDPMVVRFYLLSTHYRSPLDFDDEKLEVAQKGLDRLKNSYLQLGNSLKVAGNYENGDKLKEVTLKAMDDFIEAMNDDFNTALAIAALFDLARGINTYLKESRLDKKTLEQAKSVFDDLIGVLGISFTTREVQGGKLVEDLISLIITLRQKARKERDFTTADSIRDQLKELGIILEDGIKGTNWKANGEMDGLIEKLIEMIIAIRQNARKNKDFKTADLIRDEMKKVGIIFEDTPQGTNWKLE
ncbi:MAG: cysteinyl-tRNA synthetase [Clostridia bacterium]|jgi:cysteinyl-tRNA synthetase|nr:cysteinyl-tRNA synthetase [Clostridia bacterium]